MGNAVLKRKVQDGYQQHLLVGPVTTVGRSTTCDIVVNDTSLSRLHFRIENRNNRFHLIDNNSSNGTFLNRRKVGEALLKDGDIIITGRIQFIFNQPQEETGSRTQPMTMVADIPPVSATVAMSVDELPSGAHSRMPPPTPVTAQSPLAGAQARTPAAPIRPPVVPLDDLPPTLPPDRPPVIPAIMPDPQLRRDGPPPLGPIQPELPFSKLPPKAVSAESLQAAPPLARLLAVLLDGGVGMVLMIPAIVLMILKMGMLGSLFSLLGSLAAMAHPLIGWLKYGKTIGKHLMGLRIIEQDHPTQIGLSGKVLIMRLLGYMICGMTFYLLFLTILKDDEGRGFHDKLAGTKVIKE